MVAVGSQTARRSPAQPSPGRRDDLAARGGHRARRRRLPAGHAASSSRTAGRPAATGPDGIWTSASGRSWTLGVHVRHHARRRRRPAVGPLSRPGRGYLAAGQNTAEGPRSSACPGWPALAADGGAGAPDAGWQWHRRDITGAAAGGGSISSPGTSPRPPCRASRRQPDRGHPHPGGLAEHRRRRHLDAGAGTGQPRRHERARRHRGRRHGLCRGPPGQRLLRDRTRGRTAWSTRRRTARPGGTCRP